VPDPSSVAEADRAGPADLGQLVIDVGSVPNQIGAVLTLAGTGDGDMAELVEVLGARLSSIPRLRQRLIATPAGGGPAVWVEAPDFDARGHLEVVLCPSPGDEPALLALAAARVTTALPDTSPRWRITLVTGLAGGEVAVIAVFHHVLADGIGGLAVLSALVDGGAPASGTGAAVPRMAPPLDGSPSPDRQPQRSRRGSTAPRRRRGRRAGLRSVLGELGTRPTVATRCSLNRPTGPRREAAVVRADLAAVKGFAHAHGEATVNDVVLAAVAGALGTLLRGRGEHLDRIVATVMVAPDAAGAAADKADGAGGNRAGIAPITLPTGGRLTHRLPAITARTRPRTRGHRGASAAPFGAALRVLARLGLLRWAIDHQRMVHTFVTNLRGPAAPVTLAGRQVTDLVPISLATGNVTVAFAVLSYAGTLAITVVTDPTHHPDRDVLVEALEAELAFARPR
jgi:diacylglycerol O-acyltransferase / wax synthase